MSGYVPNNWKDRPAPTPEPYNGDFDRQSPRPLVLNPTSEPKPATEPPKPAGCVFARSCNLPEGVINHSHPGGFVPVEPLSAYGKWAVLGTLPANALGQIPLRLLGGSLTSTALSSSLGGGTLAFGAAGATGVAGAGAASAGGAMGAGGVVTAGVVAGALVGVVAMLFPNNAGEDSALYTNEQFRMLTLGRTRVRLHISQLPSGAVNAYGFYTGQRPEWEMVPVIAAVAQGDNYVADLGNGVELIWTPAVDPNEVIGKNPPLEAEQPIPHVWVYPASDQTEKVLVNPVHPPEYQDAIIWFPQTDIQPLYIVLAKPLVRPLEVGLYSDLSTRSRKDGLDIDHIPARAALTRYLLGIDPGMASWKIAAALKDAPSIAVPSRVHQKYSETYGGRNSGDKQIKDASDLRAAVDSNFDAIKIGLLEEGFAESEIEEARSDLHKLHEEQGWY